MKASEIRKLDDGQINEQINEHYRELFNLRFNKATGKQLSPGRARVVKREIARLKTILRERELGL